MKEIKKNSVLRIAFNLFPWCKFFAGFTRTYNIWNMQAYQLVWRDTWLQCGHTVVLRMMHFYRFLGLKTGNVICFQETFPLSHWRQWHNALLGHTNWSITELDSDKDRHYLREHMSLNTLSDSFPSWILGKYNYFSWFESKKGTGSGKPVVSESIWYGWNTVTLVIEMFW